jgi:hypothetical protein
MLAIRNFDKLKLYSVLIMVVTIGIVMIYRCYCTRKYKEAKFKFVKDWNLLKQIVGFASWNMLGELAWVFTGQGVNIEHCSTQLAASILSAGMFMCVFKYHTPTISITTKTKTAIPACANNETLKIRLTPASLFLPISKDKYRCTAFDMELLRNPNIATTPPTTLYIP